MVFDNIWEIWPFRGYFSMRNTRRHIKQNSKCGSNTKGHSEPLIKLLGPWESNMVALQSILIWEKPGRSAIAVIVANLIYWYLACSEIHFFFGVSILGLAAFLHHQWVYSIWPEISVPKSQDQEDWTPVHPSVLSAPEVSRYLNNTWTYIQGQQKRLAQLRRKQPGWFCVVMSVVFSVLWLVGRFISGVTLLYILLMGIMCGPAFVFRIVPKSTFKKIEQVFALIFSRNEDSSTSLENDLADFLPEETSLEVQTALGIPFTTHEQEDLQEMSKSKEKKTKGRRGKTKKSLPTEGNSFTVGLSESDFPSLEETVDTIEESDLALPEEETDSRPPVPPEGGMNFVSTHFGDSSDEDEEFSVGLTFSQNVMQNLTDDANQSATTTAANLVSQWMSNVATENTAMILSSIGQHLVSTLETPIEESTTPTEEEESKKIVASQSSFEDDDFELISDDDLQ